MCYDPMGRAATTQRMLKIGWVPRAFTRLGMRLSWRTWVREWGIVRPTPSALRGGGRENQRPAGRGCQDRTPVRGLKAQSICDGRRGSQTTAGSEHIQLRPVRSLWGYLV